MPSGPFDLVIVGSGLGALSTASLMAKLHGTRVLLIEQHSVIGGFTHTFRRKGGYRWDVGLHYVGDMSVGTMERTITDFITDEQLDWTRMEEPFEKFIYPDFTFDVHGNGVRNEQELSAHFPREKTAIGRYLRDLRAAMKWTVWNTLAASDSALTRGAVRLATWPWERIALQTTAEYLGRTIRDPKLRALLTSRWGIDGLPPSQSAFGAHAVIARHYLSGGYYPVGGAARIAETIVPVVERRGGAALTSHEVKRILVQGRRAAGVETVDREGKQHRFEARAVVSNAGAYNTYAKLLPPTVGAAHAKRLRALAQGAASAVTIYLGLKGDPRQLGFCGENHWLFEGYDHDSHNEPDPLLAGKPRWCFLSFPSLRDPGEQIHTAQIVALAGHEGFARWRDTSWQRRGDEYEQLKQQLADGLIAMVEQRNPGFAALIEHVEVSTPLSVEHFSASPFGAIYGLPSTPARLREPLVGTRTPVADLYLTGADGFAHGIFGAILSGVATSGALTGRLGFLRVLAAIKRAEGRKAA